MNLRSSVVWTVWENVEALAATLLFPAFFLFSAFVNVSIVCALYMLAGVRVHLLWSSQVREFETKPNDARAAKDMLGAATLA